MVVIGAGSTLIGVICVDHRAKLPPSKRLGQELLDRATGFDMKRVQLHYHSVSHVYLPILPSLLQRLARPHSVPCVHVMEQEHVLKISIESMKHL